MHLLDEYPALWLLLFPLKASRRKLRKQMGSLKVICKTEMANMGTPAPLVVQVPCPLWSMPIPAPAECCVYLSSRATFSVGEEIPAGLVLGSRATGTCSNWFVCRNKGIPTKWRGSLWEKPRNKGDPQNPPTKLDRCSTLEACSRQP